MVEELFVNDFVSFEGLLHTLLHSLHTQIPYFFILLRIISSNNKSSNNNNNEDKRIKDTLGSEKTYSVSPYTVQSFCYTLQLIPHFFGDIFYLILHIWPSLCSTYLVIY